MYNLAAGRYDKIKDFDPDWEERFLGEPIAAATYRLANVKLLDVGAGTGRVARALRPFPSFDGIITCVEPSVHMMSIGRSLGPLANTRWVRAWEYPLPFEDDAFDIVVSLEILEFTPSPLKTLDEMARVLRPGGWFIVTNRVGREARFILGKTFPRSAFPAVLANVGLQDIEVLPWQVEYDLAWARKPW